MKWNFANALRAQCAVLAAGLLLTGCSGVSHSKADSASNAGAPGNSVVAVTSLAGTRWQVTRVADQPVPASINSTVQFDDQGQVFGSAGCNRFTAAYQLENGGLRVKRLATTRKLCFPAIMSQEEALLRVLRGAERVYLQAGELILESARERAPSRLVPLPDPDASVL